MKEKFDVNGNFPTKIRRRMTLSFSPKQMAQLLSMDVSVAEKSQEILLALRKRSPRAFGFLYYLHITDESYTIQELAEKFGVSRTAVYLQLRKLFDYSFVLRNDVRGRGGRPIGEYKLTTSVKQAFLFWEADGKEVYVSPKHLSLAIREKSDESMDALWVS